MALRLMLHLSMLNVLLVYTHFFGWLVVGLQGLLVFVLPELRGLRRGFVWGAALTAAWFLPYAAIFIGRMAQSVDEGTWLTAPTPEELYNMVWRWSNAPVLTVAALALIAGAAWKDRLRGTGIRFAAIWAFVPLFGMFAASQVVPMFLDRYLVYAAPGFALLVGLSMNTLAPVPRLRAAAGLALGLGMAATFTPWKDTGLHPSRVVQAEKDLCAGSCSVEVLPQWYWITHLAAKDIRSLQRSTGQHMAYFEHTSTGSDAQVPSAPPDTVPVALVIDAGAHLVDPTRNWYSRLRAIYPRVDSVEADRKVWVYRFQR
jgi:mannosyltransferase